LWLGRWWCIKLYESGGSLESEDVLFEETLLDELFQVLLEGRIVDGLVSLSVMVGAVFFHFEKRDCTGLVSGV